MPVEQALVGPATKVAVEYVGRPGLARLLMAFRGKKVVVVGPPGAGKSTFMNYMHFEVFDPERNPESTIRAREAKNFKFTLGRNRSLLTSIKQALDMPGQPDPRWIAEEVFQARPQALIIVLDTTAPVEDETDPRSTAVWLRKFCRAADQATRGMRRNRLRTVIVALNKADRSSEAQYQEHESCCEEILREWRASAQGAPDPHILRCISVSTGDSANETKWIDAVLSNLAISLREDS